MSIKLLLSHGFDHIFAFTADGLIPSILSSFLVDVAQRVIVEGFDISKFLFQFLDNAPFVARHTAIIHLANKPGGGVVGRKYIWSHKNIQPWGQQLPSQCQECWSFRPWDQGKQAMNGVDMVFRCSGKKFDGSNCSNKLHFRKPEALGQSHSGNWLSLQWPEDQWTHVYLFQLNMSSRVVQYCVSL